MGSIQESSPIADQLERLAGQADLRSAVGDESARKSALAACSKIQAQLEDPFEKTLRILFSGHQVAGLRLAVDMGVFDVAAKLGPGEQISLEKLATECKAEAPLLKRVMRFNVALGLFEEPAAGSYRPLPTAKAYVSESPLSSVVVHISHFYIILSQLPEYFAANGWKNPGDDYDGPFQFAMHSKQHYFDFLASNPYYQRAFNKVMTIAQRRRGQNWYQFFPVEEKLQVADPKDVVVVDVGGSHGDDLRALREAHPSLPGRMVLQDLPNVIDELKDVPPGVEAQGYDFFTPQPIKGAKAYYLRTVLHDWPDKQAVKILRRVAEAMTPDSMLLINEAVLPESNVAMSAAQADFTMMVSFASLERTEEQFRTLLDDAGFELVRVWGPETATLAEQAQLIEARLKE